MTGNHTRHAVVPHNTLPAWQGIEQQGQHYYLNLSFGVLDLAPLLSLTPTHLAPRNLAPVSTEHFAKQNRWQLAVSLTGAKENVIDSVVNPQNQAAELLSGLVLLAAHIPAIHCIDVSCLYTDMYADWQAAKQNQQAATLPSILDELIDRSEPDSYLLWRASLLQLPSYWLTQPRTHLVPHKQILSKQGYHPMRPQPQQGELYRRYIPELQQSLSLLGLELDAHLPLFNQWQNNPRVAAFWEQTGSLDEHKSYLQEQLANDKNQLLIVCLDNEPFAYIEAYWSKEDRIAPYYQAGDYDRGIHMLVGEEHHRGTHKIAAWLPSVCHYLYLSDPRTERIVSEPRADNEKMMAYLQHYGFAKVKEFNFPHKRAALMSQLRDTFFNDCF